MHASLPRRLLAARRPRALALVLIALVSALAGAAVEFGHLLAGVEQASVAARFGLRHAQVPRDVVVVGIDDKTFDDLQLQWPFPRSLHGRAIDRLHAAGARAIVYDIQLTEPTQPNQDMALYDAIGRAGGALLATGESDGHGHTNVLGGDANLAAVNARAGATNFTTDSAGAMTRFPRAVAGLESLPVVTAERVQGAAPPRAGFAGGGAWIDYRGRPGTVPTLSFSNVLRGNFDPAAVRGKVVVVGATAPTLQDLHATPVGGGQPMSGPEVEANAIWTALHGIPLRDAPLRFDLALLLLLALVPPLARWRLGLVGSVAACLAAAGAFLVTAQLAFGGGAVLAVGGPLAALAFGTAAMVLGSYREESRERRRVAAANETLSRDVRLRTEELEDTQLEVVRRLAAAVESRDAETGSHVERIGRLCEELALAAGMSPADAATVRHASALHDMGKIAIPDSVLLKPGKLEAPEWETMKTHANAGAGLLAGSRSPLLQLAEVIARTHHERWDGSGYPAGLAGEEIPLTGRICAICDVYDALVSKRPYKDAQPVEEALAELQRCAGTQFDPRLVDLFVAMIRRDDDASELARWPIKPDDIVIGEDDAEAATRP